MWKPTEPSEAKTMELLKGTVLDSAEGTFKTLISQRAGRCI